MGVCSPLHFGLRRHHHLHSARRSLLVVSLVACLPAAAELQQEARRLQEGPGLGELLVRLLLTGEVDGG